jgi:hypothetical protein
MFRSIHGGLKMLPNTKPHNIPYRREDINHHQISHFRERYQLGGPVPFPFTTTHPSGNSSDGRYSLTCPSTAFAKEPSRHNRESEARGSESESHHSSVKQDPPGSYYDQAMIQAPILNGKCQLSLSHQINQKKRADDCTETISSTNCTFPPLFWQQNRTTRLNRRLNKVKKR